jgi:phosphoribosylanthranilate isomerase
MKPRIQIAGVTDQQEAQMLIEEGVDDLGFPLGPGVLKKDLSEIEAGKIFHSIRPPVYGVLITYLDNAKEVMRFCEQLGARKVQLHGEIATKEVAVLKRLAPEIYIIKSLVVREDNLACLEAKVAEFSPYVDAFITDTYDPLTGLMGATGKVHNWKVSEKLVTLSSRPIILAGGLNADNVAQAIMQVRPAGVDSHTGVEEKNGRKDRKKIKLFVERARSAFSSLPNYN